MLSSKNDDEQGMRTSLSRNAIIALVIILAGGSRRGVAQGDVHGLDPSKHITQYTLEIWQNGQGLPQSTVYALAQSADGYLWVGTQAGVSRFDGVTFKTWSPVNTPGIRNRYIRALLHDREGQLWLGTSNGGVSRMARGRFDAFETSSAGHINVLHQDRRGVIRAGSDSGLLVLEGNRFRAVPGSREAIRSLTELKDGTLLIGTESGIQTWTGQKLERWNPPDGAVDGQVSSMLQDREGNLWIGTSHGLVRSTGGNFERFTTADRLPSDRITSMIQTRNGQIWIGTSNGVARYYQGTFEAFSSREGLEGTEVSSVLEGLEGDLWIGTENGGINRFRDPIFTTYGKLEGMPTDMLWSAYGDRDGSLWVGTDRAGLIRFRSGQITVYDSTNGFPSQSSYATVQTRDGALWVGGDRGLIRYRSGRWEDLSQVPGAPTGWISALHQDTSGALWIGAGAGLYRFQDGAFQSFSRDIGVTTRVWTICEDRNGDLWFGTTGEGLVQLRDGRFRTYTPADGLTNGVIHSLMADEYGLWIGMEFGGLDLMRNGKITHLPFSDRLALSDLYHIDEDTRGNLWLSSSQGLYSVAKSQLLAAAEGRRQAVDVRRFDTMDGLRRTEFNGAGKNSGWQDRDGRLWFPTVKGLVVVDPGSLRTNPVTPAVYVNGITVMGRLFEAGSGLVLPAGGNDLEISYTATSLLVPSRVVFRYKLEGYDEDWIEAGNRRIAYYTGVPGGDYRFRVIAANNDGVWNEVGSGLAFRVRPTFQETPWFWALVSVVAIALAYLVVRWRLHHVEHRSRELTQLVEERTAELVKSEEQLRQAQKMEAIGQLTGGIAHDLNNVLTAVIAHVDLAVATLPPEPGLLADLTQAQTAAHRGAGIIRKLLGFSRRERLILKPLSLGQLVEELSGTMRRLLPSYIITTVDVEPDVPLVSADAGAVQQMLLNLATNARDAMPEGGRLHIEVRRTLLGAEHVATYGWGEPGTYVTLIVSDTGAGMDTATLDRIFEPFFSTKGPGQGSGLGMAMVYGLIKQHRGHVAIQSEPDIGTVATLYFPVTTGHLQEATQEVHHPLVAGHGTILLVEDEVSVRSAATRALTRFGYRVLVASDGIEGLKVWREHVDEIDLILSDTIMPRMGGLALHDIVSREAPNVRFLLTSGYSGEEMSRNGNWRPDLPFLAKPWTVRDLLAGVQEVLKTTGRDNLVG
jgi:ligand-binding sensor domain-containing protein/signal transduction histidine kinase/CheY-like chemotaxis protein